MRASRVTQRLNITLISLIFGLLACSNLHGRTLPLQLKTSLDSMINKVMARGAFPGASLAIGDPQGLLYIKNYGYHDYSKAQKVDNDDLYDVASCTKVLSTTFVLMRLYDQKLFSMDQTIGSIIPQFKGKQIDNVTIKELLTHTSGIGNQTFYPLLVKNSKGGSIVSNRNSTEYPYRIDQNIYMARDVILDSLYITDRKVANYRAISDNYYVNPSVDTVICNHITIAYKQDNRGKYLYCDANFYILKLIIEKITGRGLDILTANLMTEIESPHSGYNPLTYLKQERIIPTEDDYLLRRGPIQGVVHDELSALSGGVGGNAGLFSNTEDISHFCEMILNGGLYRGKRIISRSTIQLFTSSPLSSQGIYRGYGFDKRNPSDSFSLGGDDKFGHTGFTGTIFWINRTKGFYMIFLSNRVHPTRMNNELSSSQLRGKLWERLSSYF